MQPGSEGSRILAEVFENVKNEKYDVGVIGVWYGCNYGSIATYYALSKVLQSMGKSVLMIEKPQIGSNDYNDYELGFTHSRRFASERYNISERYKLSELGKLNDLCNAFLLGSDQLWNYGISKNTGKAFYLDFAASDKKKIAYGTSFGHGIDFAPVEERKVIAEYMAQFDGIALREDDGVKICENDYGINAIQALDPVFLADEKIYEPLIEKSKVKIEEPYLLAYILDPTGEKIKAIEEVAKKKGDLPIYYIVDGLPQNFKKNKALLGNANVLENVEVEEWLSALYNANFVITDSCHGASFALIFKKDFVAICNKARGFSRFASLGRLFKVETHIVSKASDILNNEAALAPVDYEKVDKIMTTEKDRCYKWLYDVLNCPKKTETQLIDENVIGNIIKRKACNTVTTVLEKEMCVGCGACVSCCPKEAISLEPDKWGYYRSTVDYTKCVQCKKCISVCPALNTVDTSNTITPSCNEFVSSSDELLMKSSSGGVFGTLATMILERGGCVVGAAWADDFSVEHIIIDRLEDLHKLQKSKYLQSYTGNIMKRTKELVETGRDVLFVGSPCQITGIRSYLNKEYSNLYLVDFFCGNAPSAGFFKKYLDDSFGKDVSSYQFRYKDEKTRWSCKYTMTEMKDGTRIKHFGENEDYYQRVFHNHTMCAPHCEKCKYQAFPRVGDISIGDFWGISKLDIDLETRKGVSIVLCNNEKGQNLFDSISPNDYRVKKEVPLKWMGGNGYSRNGGHNHCSEFRDRFYMEILNKPFSKAVDSALNQYENDARRWYSSSNTPLQFDCNMIHFSFETDFWEEHFIDGMPTLIVKNGKWNENGHYARLALGKKLALGKEYTISAKVLVNTQSSILNFHIIKSGSKKVQVIHSENITKKNDGNHWVEFTDVFKPNADYYDEFMFGAAQIIGMQNFIKIAYINITEK